MEIKIFYQKVGSGFPVIFLPGLGLNHLLFEDCLDYIKDKFEIILVDLFGCGNSPKPVEGYSIKDDGFEVKKIVEKYPSIYVVAHSRGVKVSLFLSTIYKGIKKSVFIGQAGFGKKDDIFKRNVEEVRKNFKILCKEELAKKLEEGLNFGKVNGVDSLIKLKKAKEKSDIFDSLIRRLEEPIDYKEIAKEIDFKVHFVMGEKDPFLDDVYDAIKIYKKSNLHIIKNCGHFPMLENPYDFYSLLNKILMED